MEVFGKYLLLERLGAGGMAEVFLAKSAGASGINKFVAIKRILPQHSDNEEFVDMFKEEAKIAVNLNHSNVVSIFDFGFERKQFYLAMEYFEGQNLRQALNHLKKTNKQLSIEQIVYILKQVATGLDHAHRCLDGTTGKSLNIIHRDMSPQNIMISFEGEVKIVDFGIAKAETQIEQTRVGTIKGKFGYMSPEQAEGLPLDVRTDIFSIGIVLWELLANERLFTANSEAAIIRKVKECQITPVRKLNPQVPPELERITMKALTKDRNLRYQNAAAFHRDLNRFLNTQYPDFSPHDFSVFMKSNFANMFVENRRKLVEYAKAQGGIQIPEETNEERETPNTNSSGGMIGLMPEREVAESLSIDPEASREIDLSDLSKIKASEIMKPSRNTQTKSNNYHQTITQKTKDRVRREQAKSNSSLNYIFPILGFLVIGVVAFLFTQNRSVSAPRLTDVATSATPESQPSQIIKQPEVTGTTLSSVTKALPYVMVIESEPSGARVILNGEDTGLVTPLRRTLPANSVVQLGLKMEGFQYYQREITISKDGDTFKATLLKAPNLAYVNIELVNAGNDPVIKINGERISEKPPIRLYGIPAGTPVVIEASNPFTGLKATQTVTVRANQKRDITLILSRTAGQ